MRAHLPRSNTLNLTYNIKKGESFLINRKSALVALFLFAPSCVESQVGNVIALAFKVIAQRIHTDTLFIKGMNS